MADREWTTPDEARRLSRDASADWRSDDAGALEDYADLVDAPIRERERIVREIKRRAKEPSE